MNTKIGLLLPRSVIYPAMAFDMMAGIKNGLEKMGHKDAELVTEQLGTGANDKLTISACEKMMLDGVKLICGYMNPVTAERLQPMLAAAGAMLVCMDAGYHYPSAMQAKANVFYVSLQGALCSRIVTKMAITEGGKRMAFAGSYYESGYRSPYSFYRCMEEEDGEVTITHITQLKRADFSLEPLKAKVAEGGTDAVFATFCGDMLQDYYKHLAANEALHGTPVFGAPFTADELWLDQSPWPGMMISSCVPWGRGLDNEENKLFIAQLQEQDRVANMFSTLGHDAGQLLGVVLGQPTVKAAIAALEGHTFAGPRGQVVVEAETHHVIGPVYAAAVVQNGDGCALQVGEVSPFFDEQLGRWKDDINTQPAQFTSWYNAYGCLDS